MYKCADITKIVLAGAGVMGESFAQIFAGNGYTVTLYDISGEALEKAKTGIKQGLKTQAEQGAIDPGSVKEILDHISYTTSKDCFEDAQLLERGIRACKAKGSTCDQYLGSVYYRDIRGCKGSCQVCRHALGQPTAPCAFSGDYFGKRKLKGG